MEGLGGVGLCDDETNRMQPLKPRHHSAGIIPNERGVNAIRLESGLRDVRFGLARECSNDKLRLEWHSTCLVGGYLK